MDWDERKPLEGLARLSKNINLAFKKIPVVAVWRVLGRRDENREP